MSESEDRRANLRWDLVNTVYKDLDILLCEHINKNKLTFIEIETVLRLMGLKLLSAEIKHLTSMVIEESVKGSINEIKGCYM